MRTHRNGTLAQAMALLVHNQAALVAQIAEINKDRVEIERRTELRFKHIEKTMDEMKAILVHHDQLLAEHSRILKEIPEILARLPEAVRRKIGFKPK